LGGVTRKSWLPKLSVELCASISLAPPKGLITPCSVAPAASAAEMSSMIDSRPRAITRPRIVVRIVTSLWTTGSAVRLDAAHYGSMADCAACEELISLLHNCCQTFRAALGHNYQRLVVDGNELLREVESAAEADD